MPSLLRRVTGDVWGYAQAHPATGAGHRSALPPPPSPSPLADATRRRPAHRQGQTPATAGAGIGGVSGGSGRRRQIRCGSPPPRKAAPVVPPPPLRESPSPPRGGGVPPKAAVEKWTVAATGTASLLWRPATPPSLGMAATTPFTERRRMASGCVATPEAPQHATRTTCSTPARNRQYVRRRNPHPADAADCHGHLDLLPHNGNK